MARTARIVLEGVAHHVVARGVNRTKLFRHSFDKRKYLKRFAEIAAEEDVQVHGYCLMKNHVHWLLTPATLQGLSRLFTGRCGHLFQNRFHSSPLGEEHYWTALRYVEVNPRRAGLVEKLEEWDFSSARAHLTGVDDPLISLVAQIGRRTFTIAGWREFLERTDAEKERESCAALPGSRPCGSLEWISSLEEGLKRKLSKSPRGRPRITQESLATA